MHDFHVYPHDPLAVQASVLLAEYDPEAWVAIRGTLEGSVRVVEAPHDHATNPAYLWGYVNVGDWLDDYAEHV